MAIYKKVYYEQEIYIDHVLYRNEDDALVMDRVIIYDPSDEEINQWLEENGIITEVESENNYLYLTEEDALLFELRWN